MEELSKVVFLFCWFSFTVMAAKAGTTNEGRIINLKSIILSYIHASSADWIPINVLGLTQIKNGATLAKL